MNFYIKVIFIFSFFLSSSVWANDEESIVSVITGGATYLVVTPGSGSSERPLGVYVRRGGEWKMALPGNIQVGEQGPILHQLEISRLDKRSQSILIRDGKLTLISQITDENSDSYLEIGSVENPILHPVTQTDLYLPQLSTPEDVSFYEDKEENYSLLYISVKIRDRKGYTFVLKVKPIEENKIQLGAPLYLLHDGFLTPQELIQFAQMSHGNQVPSTVVGRYIVEGIMTKYSKYQNLLKNWYAKDVFTFNDLPVVNFDLDHQKYELNSQPHFILSEDIRNQTSDQYLYQVIDVDNSEKYIARKEDLQKTKIGCQEKRIPGLIDLNSYCLPFYKVLFLGKGPNKSLEFYSIDGEFFAGILGRSELRKMYKIGNDSPEELSLTPLTAEIGNPGEWKFQIIASLLYKSGSKKTAIWEFVTKEDQIVGFNEITFKHFENEYFTPLEIESRFKKTTDSRGKSLVLYTPQTVSEESIFNKGINIHESFKLQDSVLGYPEYLDNGFKILTLPTKKILVHEVNPTEVLLELYNKAEDVFSKSFEIPKDIARTSIPSQGEMYKEYLMVFSYKLKNFEDGPADSIEKNKRKKSSDKGSLNIYFLKVSIDGKGRVIHRQFFVSRLLKNSPVSMDDSYLVIKSENPSEPNRFFYDNSLKKDQTLLIDIEKTILSSGLVESKLGKRNLIHNQSNQLIRDQFKSQYPGLDLIYSDENPSKQEIVQEDGTVLYKGDPIVRLPSENSFGDKEKASRLFYFESNGEKGKISFLQTHNKSLVVVLEFVDKKNKEKSYFIRTLNYETAGGIEFDPDRIKHIDIFVNNTKTPIKKGDLEQDQKQEATLFESYVVSKFKKLSGDAQFLTEMTKDVLEYLNSQKQIINSAEYEVSEKDFLEYVRHLKGLDRSSTQTSNEGEEKAKSIYDVEIEKILNFKPVLWDGSHQIFVSFTLSFPEGSSYSDQNKNKPKSPLRFSDHIFGLSLSYNKKIITPDKNLKIFYQGYLPAGSSIRHRLAKREGRWLYITHSSDDLLSKGLTLVDLFSGEKFKPNEVQNKTLKDEIEYLIPVTQRKLVDPSIRFNFEGSWLRNPQGFSNEIMGGEKRLQVNEFALKLFGGVKDQINHYLKPSRSYKMKVLLLPPSILPLVSNYLADEYRNGAPEEMWSERNSQMRFFSPSVVGKSLVSQDNVVDNLEVISKVGPSKNLLFFRLDSVENYTPVNKNGMTLYGGANHLNFDNSKVSTEGNLNLNAKLVWPHLSFLLASQGDTSMSYQSSREKSKELNFPVLMIGTRDQWDKFSQSSGEFLNSGLEEWFEVTDIQPPSLEDKINLLVSLFKHPQISMLNYKFDSKGISPKGVAVTQDEAFYYVLRYAVNRVESNAKTSNQNAFSIYLEFLSLLSEVLVKDKFVRNSQTVDKAVIERLMSRMFNLPLNRNFLPVDHPLYILSQPNAAVKLQEIGYTGPITLKKRLIDVLTSQLTHSQVKAIPSSMILAGETGSGKTHFFESLVQLLKLNYYDFTNPMSDKNKEASAIFIKADKLTADGHKSTSTNSMSVDQAIIHLEHFLSLPNGYQGYILIDDLHAALDPVREKLLLYLRGLFESKDGKYTIVEQNPDVTARVTGFRLPIKQTTNPVGGLNIVVTMNFAENSQRINQFAKEGKEPTFEERILGSLVTKNLNLEGSFLKRWGDIIPLSTFPADAKAPGLLKDFFVRSRSILDLKSRLVLLSPYTVKNIVEKFKNMNARTFLADTTNEFLQLFESDHDDDQIALQILVPIDQSEYNDEKIFSKIADMGKIDTKQTESAHSNYSEIGQYVHKNTQVVTINESYESQLHFLRWLMTNFRFFLYENLLNALEESVLISGTSESQKITLFPLFQALYDHLLENEDIPMGVLNLDPNFFNQKQSHQKTEFYNFIKKIDKTYGFDEKKKYFPFGFTDKTQIGRSLGELTNLHSFYSMDKNRKSVVASSLSSLEPEIKKFFEKYYRISSLTALPKLNSWLNSLKESDPSVKENGSAIVNQFLNFRYAIFDSNLSEFKSNQGATLSAYQVSRIYLYILDKAITQMPWETLTRFYSESMVKISEDMTLSQLPGFQFLLSTDSKTTPLRPRSRDLILTHLTNSPAFKEEYDSVRKSQKIEFNQSCSALLEGR